MSTVEGWKTSSLPLLLRFMKSGGTPNTSRSDYYGGQIPFVSIEDMTASNKHLTSTIKKLTDKGLKNSNAWIVPEKSILYSIYATLGLPRINTIPVTTNQAILALINDPNKIDRDYLYYWLEYIRASVINFSSQTTQSNLSATIVKTFLVDHPTDLSEQTKIAEVLSMVDRAIEQTEALIAKQQRIKTGLMQDLLTCGIDEHGNLRSEQTHKFKDSKTLLGWIPVEWEAPTIDELTVHVGSGLTPRGGESVYTKEGVLFIRSQNVHFGGLLLADVSYIPQKIHITMKRSEVFENDVLLNITGASIGRCCPMPAINYTANVNQHVCAIRLSKATQSDAGYLTAVIESSIGQNQILQFNAGGNREGLNYQQVRSFVIPWPKVEERQRLHAVIKESAEALKVSGHNLEKLRALKTALMQDLLTGKKRVTALLTRINENDNGKGVD